ncbi:hypothetical protein ABW20_dc0106039 [Dactylellina cionopaga]|nr:hypothetical protein ABW20_dc0106039 [Dactylellina cionopaga]
MAAESVSSHIGRRMLAEKRRHQLLTNGTRGFAAMDSADVTVDIDALVRRAHARPTSPTETDWWYKVSLGSLQPQKPMRNLLHVKTGNTVESLAGWSDVLKYIEMHPIRTYLYDNRVQKATINTILASLKLVDSLLLVAKNNADTIEDFLSEDVYNQKTHLPYFWTWKRSVDPAANISGTVTRVNTSDTGDSCFSSSPSAYTTATLSSQILLSQACPTQYAELVRDKEYFVQVQDVLKGWEVDLRGQMQLIFNLISIDEAYRSREQNTSLKRLSWITFIFLPMLFMSSIFGMNIDLLLNNPAWWWYLVWTAPMLVIVLLFWFVYRVWDQRRIAEEELPFKIA